MAKKSAAIVGGILGLLGAAGLFVILWFFVGPVLEMNTAMGQMINSIFWLQLIAAYLAIPLDPALVAMLVQISLYAEILQVMNSFPINILGLGVALRWWVIGDIGLIALGAILSFVGAGED